MSHATLIPVSEYLKNSYSPDCDYIDGELLERNVGEREHAALQAILVNIFQTNRRMWGVFGMPELRTQVSHFNFAYPMFASCEPATRETILFAHRPSYALKSSQAAIRSLD